MLIAIVDDQIADLRVAATFIKKYIAKNFSETAQSVHIETFSNPEEFLRDFVPNSYDLLILDIFMKPLNGIQVAQSVRESDRDVAIIFLTSSEDYILEGYKVFAVGYFLKPLVDNADQFDKIFYYIFPKLCDNQKRLIVRAGGVEVVVPHKNIHYVDIADKHHVCIHLSDKKISTTTTYEEIASALESDSRFVECYHRVIVNMDFIRRMESDNFVLVDGDSVPISKRKSKSAKLKYMAHLISVGSSNTWLL